MPIIRDVMSRRVVTVSPEATLLDAARILCENSVGGAPVVGATGELVGFIAEPRLVDVLFDEDARQARVVDYMTADVHAVRPDDSLSDAARLLVLYGIRRLPVVDNGELLGIVTRRDLMNYALGTGEVLTDPLVELIPWLAPMT